MAYQLYQISSGKTSTGLTLSNDSMFIHSGGTANSTTVNSGGSGNDAMHGGGGNDTFCFGENWGNDTVEQLAGGTVTLWFDVAESEVVRNGNVFTFGENSVEVKGKNLTINLKFDDADSSGVPEGAFADFASEKIFEENNSGSLA